MAIVHPRPLSSTHTAFSIRVVSPHATNDLPDGPCRGLWVNDNGVVAVSVVAANDSAAVTVSVSGPGLIPIAGKAVRVSGTAAASIVALY